MKIIAIEKELMKEDRDKWDTDFENLWEESKEMNDFCKIVHATHDAYLSFVTFFMSATTGPKKGEKVIRKESKKGGCLDDPMILTPSDEAYLILEVENRWENYRDEANFRKLEPQRMSWTRYKIPEDDSQKFAQGKWTSTKIKTKAGKEKWVSCEWTEEGLKRYKEILKACREWRAKDENKGVRKKLVESLNKKREEERSRNKRKEIGGDREEKAEKRRNTMLSKNSIIEECTELVEV